MSRAARGISIILKWNGRGFVPDDPWAEEQCAKLEPGQLYTGDFTKATASGVDWRIGANKKYWAALNVLIENRDEFVDARSVHDHLMGKLGYIWKRWRADGTFIVESLSIASSNMRDDDFEVLVERMRAHCVEEFGFDPMQEWEDRKDYEARMKLLQERGRR